MLAVLSDQLGPLVRAVPGGAASAALAMLFLAVFLGVIGAAALAGGRDPVRRRLAGHAARERIRAEAPTLRSAGAAASRWDRLLKPLETRLAERASGAHSALRTRLLRAGLSGPHAARTYVLIRAALAAGLPLALVSAMGAAGTAVPVQHSLAGAFALAGAGFALPGLWLSRRIARRQRTIAESFPDALDLMVICVEAGLGLDAAVLRVGSQITRAHPVLGAELALVALELRAGKSREDALRNFARRIGLREIASFVTLLIQSEALGASVAQTLRIHAEEIRAHRMIRAEEMAHKVPVKLTVPLVLCVLPAMMTAVLLPGMITIVRVVLPSLGN